MKNPLVSLLCASTLVFGPVVASVAVGQQVKTPSGIVRGHAAKISGAQDVSEYLGIRFGEATDGTNRFMKPKPYTSDEQVEASKFVSPSGSFVLPLLLTSSTGPVSYTSHFHNPF
jgi:hypothetical protein